MPIGSHTDRAAPYSSVRNSWEPFGTSRMRWQKPAGILPSTESSREVPAQRSQSAGRRPGLADRFTALALHGQLLSVLHALEKHKAPARRAPFQHRTCNICTVRASSLMIPLRLTRASSVCRKHLLSNVSLFCPCVSCCGSVRLLCLSCAFAVQHERLLSVVSVFCLPLSVASVFRAQPLLPQTHPAVPRR